MGAWCVSDAEGLGTLVGGALTASAVENERGATNAASGPDGHTHEAACLNCGTALTGSHCHACGQKAHVHRTLSAFFHDLIHGVLHFDGKLWRTVPKLAWRPGELTRAYIDGERVKYFSPIALFLFVVFLFYAYVSLHGGIMSVSQTPRVPTVAQLEDGRATLQARIAEQEAEVRTAEEAYERRDARRTLGVLQTELANHERLLELHAVGDLTPTQDEGVTFEGDEPPETIVEFAETVWQMQRDQPDLLVYKLTNNAYKLSWLLIPLSVPFLWLLFPFSKRFRLYDHTVFVTYSIAVMTVLFIIASFGGSYGLGLLAVAAILYAPFHLYRHLKGTYGLTHKGTLWRFPLLLIFMIVTLTLFALVMLATSVM